MRKPIIYLADTDYRYLETLEFMFAEALGNDMELQVITDEDYFRELFVRAVCADVLLVSENLYYEELCRHEIRKIIVLSEKEVQQPQSRKYTVVNKYSNAKGILHEAMHILDTEGLGGPKKNRRSSIICVGSAVGGSGKTTIAAGLAKCLSTHHARVLYLNTEMSQSFSYFLNDKCELDNQACRIFRESPAEAYHKLKKYMRGEGFAYLPPLSMPFDAFQIPVSAYAGLAGEARDSGDFDYIVIDLDSGCGQANAEIIAGSDAAVIVVQQDPLSIIKTNFMLRSMDCSDEEKFIFICNKYKKMQEGARISQGNEKYQVSGYIGIIEQAASLQAVCENPGIQELAYLFL